MAESEKFYWLRLKRDFFKRHDITLVEAMENGKDYVLFYLKLLCESIDHNGNLRFSETIPYNEKMLSVITNTNIDIVKSAIQVFQELNMIEILDDGTLYMQEITTMIGSETKWAEKKREYRKAIKGQCPNDVLTMSDKRKSIEKEKETEIEKEKKLKKKAYGENNNVKLTDDEYNRLCNDYGQEKTRKAIDFLDSYIEEKGYKTKSHNLTLRRWVFNAVDEKKTNRVAQTQNGTFDMLKDWSVSE